jgi:regulator of protease activity HflC (stomatin/prohibitin superfamily)
MSHDQQTFNRAANTALIGLGVQTALALALGLLGLYAESAALIAMTWHLVGGIPLWLVLWVLFNQHRLERLEALESEQLAGDDAAAAALFNEAGDQLALARRRLDRLYKVGLKVTALLLSIYLLALGGGLCYAHFQTLTGAEPEALGLDPAKNRALVGMIVFIGGVVGFLLARYVAGMTQVNAWIALRSGATYLMGNVVVFALALIALVMVLFGDQRGFIYLAVIVPGFMVLLGLEMVLGLILSLYRPIRKGEFQRPAFDSRILGFLAQPQSLGKIITDTINYQFGFEISRSWFYRLLSRATLPLILLCVLLVIGMSSVVIVAPQQQAVVTTFGQFDRIAGPGLHFKYPWPVGRVDKYDVDRVQQIIVGSRPGATGPITDKAVLWTNPHTEGDQKEVFLITAPHTGDEQDDGVTLGELIGGDAAVQYRIEDLRAYVNAVVDPDQALSAIAEREISAAFRTRSVDDLLGINRLDFGRQLQRRIQADIDRWGLGIEVINVAVMALHPPQDSEVAAAFHEQVGAQQKGQATIENARKEAVSILANVAGSPTKAESLIEAIGAVSALDADVPAEQRNELEAEIDRQIVAAGGEAAQRLLEARAKRWQLAVTERARAERFGSEYEAYRQAPNYYRARLYLETLAQAVRDRRKIILDTDEAPPLIRLELKEPGTAIEGLFSDN